MKSCTSTPASWAQHSASRAITAEIVTRLRGNIRVRQSPRRSRCRALPHLSAASLARSDATEAARAERAMADFLAADVIVIGAPMYNFSIPSTLKAWIDRVAVAGKTFRYTASGPEGLREGQARVPGDHPGRGARTWRRQRASRILSALCARIPWHRRHHRGACPGPGFRQRSVTARWATRWPAWRRIWRWRREVSLAAHRVAGRDDDGAGVRGQGTSLGAASDRAANLTPAPCPLPRS